MGFTTLDYVVLVCFLAANVLFGTWISRGQRNTRDYFLAGKRVPWWAVCLSIVATETSTLTFIGAPAIAYAGNLTFLQVTMGYVVGKLLVTGFLMPLYFRGEIQTAYQLLQTRFGKATRNFSAGLFQVTRSLADGVRLFATGLVLSVITGLSDIWTVAIIGAITIIYTFYGGMTAVIWTDVIQFLIYICGAVLALYVLLERIPGGWEGAVALAEPLEKFRVFDFTADLSLAYSFWAGILGGAFLTFATHGTDQMMVQRYLASGSRKQSQFALMLSGIIVFFQFALFLVIGVLLFAFYHFYPLQEELVQTDRIFPLFIVQQLPAGVSGLVIAAIFAAAMSTLSSSLNSLASSSVNDFYRPYLMPEATEAHYLKASRGLTLAWGAMLILISILARNWGSVLEVGLTITSITMGSVLGIFLLGLWVPATRQRAGLSGMAAGLMVMVLLAGTPALAWTWYVLAGTCVTLLVGTLVSLLPAGNRQ
jgi:solute:Na+ symporter, SSS family